MSDTARVEALARGDVRRERSRREIFWCAAGDRRRLGDGRRLPRFACSFRAARRDRPGAKRTMSRARRRGKRRHKKELAVPARAYYGYGGDLSIHRY